MTEKEKLVELLAEPCRKHTHCSEDYCKRNREHCQSDFADHLLSNGVNFAKDTDDGGKWISVEDDKPKRRGHYFIAYKFAGSDMRFYGEAFWHDDIPDNGYVQGNHFSNEGVDGMYVTHWMEIQKLPAMQEVPNGTDHV